MTQPKEKVRINFIGIGCVVVKANVDEEIWSKITACSDKLKIPIENIFFDCEFYTLLNMPEYKSWRDFNNMFEVSGLLDDEKSMIEIRINNKRKKKFYFSELYNENLLFPLYNVEKINVEKRGNHKNITIIETDIGTIATYQFFCENFEIEKLKFILSAVNVNADKTFNILSEIFYDGNTLSSNHADTLVNKQMVYVE